MKKYALLAVLAAFFLPAALCPAQPAQKLKRFDFTQIHMGTEFRISLYADSQEQAQKASDTAFARIAELDNTLSDYKKDSELMQLCRKAGGPPVRVSKDLFQALERSQHFARLTGGSFDVTVGPIVRLWRRARRTRQLPDEKKLKDALAKVGFGKVRLDPIMQTVQLLVAGMLLDLGGIGKGIAADTALEVLRQMGFTRALVAASGDIAVGEPPPNKKGWKIAIASLKNPDGAAEGYLLLKNAAVSTSGDAEQFVVINGKRYSHIVDPRTGMGLVGRSSVTVVAPNCTTTDGLDTGLSVLGPEKGVPLVESIPGAAVLFVRERPDGSLERITSKRFAGYLYPKEKTP
jgi:thiamine biosynthesis lipoprotein